MLEWIPENVTVEDWDAADAGLPGGGGEELYEPVPGYQGQALPG